MSFSSLRIVSVQIQLFLSVYNGHFVGILVGMSTLLFCYSKIDARRIFLRYMRQSFLVYSCLLLVTGTVTIFMRPEWSEYPNGCFSNVNCIHSGFSSASSFGLEGLPQPPLTLVLTLDELKQGVSKWLSESSFLRKGKIISQTFSNNSYQVHIRYFTPLFGFEEDMVIRAMKKNNQISKVYYHAQTVFSKYIVNDNLLRRRCAEFVSYMQTLSSKQAFIFCSESISKAFRVYYMGHDLLSEQIYWKVMTENDKILLEPFKYLCANPGKEIRSQLIESFDSWLHVPSTKLDIIKRVVEMLHNASLLIDDVEDESTLRRGIPVAHKIFGTAQTINCANYVYFLALQDLLLLKDSFCIEIYTEEMLNLHRGQGMDIIWRDGGQCPSEEEYLEMIQNKTGGLLRLAVKLMQQCSTVPKDYVPLVNLIGRIYQIRDDYVNLKSDEYMKNKSFCEDLTEGKFSFPIIHSIRSQPENSQLLNILKQKTKDYELKKYAIKIMESTNSFEYTLNYLNALFKQAQTVIENLGGNPQLQEIISMLKI